MTDKEATAARIRGLRAEAKLTQAELAEMIEVSDMTISNYEKAYTTPDIITARRMADLFGVSLDYLAGRTPKEVA